MGHRVTLALILAATALSLALAHLASAERLFVNAVAVEWTAAAADPDWPVQQYMVEQMVAEDGVWRPLVRTVLLIARVDSPFGKPWRVRVQALDIAGRLSEWGETHELARVLAVSGDCDDDGVISGIDFGCFRRDFGGANPRSDLDADGTVGGRDFGLWRQAFGRSVCPGAPPSTAAELIDGACP